VTRLPLLLLLCNLSDDKLRMQAVDAASVANCFYISCNQAVGIAATAAVIARWVMAPFPWSSIAACGAGAGCCQTSFPSAPSGPWGSAPALSCLTGRGSRWACWAWWSGTGCAPLAVWRRTPSSECSPALTPRPHTLAVASPRPPPLPVPPRCWSINLAIVVLNARCVTVHACLYYAQASFFMALVLDLASWTSGVLGRFEEYVDACKRIAPELRRQGAQIVIAMTHSKLP
jgi:hypothetical protein